VLRDLSGASMGMIVGTLVGIAGGIAFHVFGQFEGAWVAYASIAIVLAGLALGRAIGASLDWRDEDHDVLVRHR
jgi:hypothetical protein